MLDGERRPSNRCIRGRGSAPLAGMLAVKPVDEEWERACKVGGHRSQYPPSERNAVGPLAVSEATMIPDILTLLIDLPPERVSQSRDEVFGNMTEAVPPVSRVMSAPTIANALKWSILSWRARMKKGPAEDP